MDDQESNHQRPGSPRALVITAIVVEGGMFFLALFLAGLQGRKLADPAEFSMPAVTTAVALTLPLAIPGIWLYLRPPRWLVRFQEQTAGLARSLFSRCTVWELATISLLAGFGEEYLFRGVFQVWLIDHFTLWPGLLLASLVFGLPHALSRAYFIAATLAGLYLGGIYLWLDNLIIVSIIHALNDFALLWLILRMTPAGKESAGFEDKE